MAEIELVIKIDEEDYKIMRHNIAVNNPLCPLSQEEMVSKVANGTQLPIGHGRLIDCDNIKTAFPSGEYVRTECVRATIDHEDTIIEADKAESEVFL